MTDSAERRARRKLIAEAYSNLPSRDTLQAAADLERAKTQRAHQNDQATLQRGSLAVAILSQVPGDDEHNKPLFAEARKLLQDILRKGAVELHDDEDETEEVDAQEGALT